MNKLIDDCIKLGFGMMRLPRVEGTNDIDLEHTKRTWRIGTDGRHRSHRSGLCHRLARTATANHWCISRLQVLMNVVYAHGERVGK